MATRDDAERYVARNMPEPAKTNLSYAATQAVVDCLITLIPLDSWTHGTPPVDLIDLHDIPSIVNQLAQPTIHWTRTHDHDLAELALEGVIVAERRIDNTTIDAIINNTHIQTEHELAAQAGTTRDQLLITSHTWS